MPIDPTIAEVTARLRKAEKRIDELDGMIADQSSEASAPPEGGPKEPKYRAVEPWVQYHFAPMYSRNVGNKWRWCRQWWKHAEAISRLEALWRSWEAARLNPVGMSTWYRDHLDHHLPILMGPDGPFHSCSKVEHNNPELLAVEPAPAGWWTK